MKVFLLGDFKSDNGPGNANKQIRDTLGMIYDIEYSKADGRLKRILEMVRCAKNSDIIVICSSSKLNYLAVRLAKKKYKRIIYLMHGYGSYEAKIANPNISEEELTQIRAYEKFMYDASDRIICVSKRCMEFMKNQIPQYMEKLDYIFNVVDTENIIKLCQENVSSRHKDTILSVGGGMRRKNNLTIAKCIDKYFVETNFTVIGNELEDGKQIKEIKSVTWIEHLPHNELCRLMSESRLYIQNSAFETFGLAIIEALYAGCSLLISSKVGCIDLFESIVDEDIIYDNTNEDEIRKKINYLLQNPNNERLIAGFNKDLVSKKWQANKWKKIIGEIM